MNESDIHYSYNSRGYMMYYKGEPIGGAGIDKHAKPARGNIALFKRSAEATKRQLLSGYGDGYMKAAIEAIDKREA